MVWEDGGINPPSYPIEMIDEVFPTLGGIYVIEEGQMQPIPLLNLGGGASPLRAVQQGEQR